MEQLKDRASTRTIKKRHLGILGLLTVLAQYGIGAKNEDTTHKALEEVLSAQLKTQRAEMREEQERDFVRKTDFNNFANKLDSLDQKISEVRGYLKKQSELSVMAPGRRVSRR